MDPKKEQEGGLLDFNWENDGESFFGVDEAKETTKEPKETVEIVNDKIEDLEEPKVKKEEKKEEEDDDIFASFEDSENTKKPEPEEASSENMYSDYYKDLKDKGILRHVEIEEGEEITSDKLFELQEKDFEEEVSARLKNWATEELDEDAKAFIKFKRDGGNTSDFFSTYSKNSEMPVGGDISEEDYQDRVIRWQLKQENWDSEEIEDRLRYLTENGKKSIAAKKYNKKIVQADKEIKNKTLEQATANKQAALKQEQEFKDSLKATLSGTKDISGVKITEKDKTQLYNFLTKKAHKISDTRSVTGFQKKLGEAFQDTDKMLLLAKLVNSDFNLEQFKKATITEKTKEIKSNIEQRKNRPSNSGSSSQGNTLAELFN